ncbi:hypothetical protein [Polaromonas jejuensis]|uniref:Uncharacterized protein n=1 Tax=Polaromonas jejuensis TaxID=457502 RepID=A0ABW0QAY8_9BURK|nr:hypothetical protein [Polaromonas jejuensis]
MNVTSGQIAHTLTIKSVEQQALQGLHRIRSLWMGTRTSRINDLRGFCREFGIAIPTGARTGIEVISRALADPATAGRTDQTWSGERRTFIPTPSGRVASVRAISGSPVMESDRMPKN